MLHQFLNSLVRLLRYDEPALTEFCETQQCKNIGYVLQCDIVVRSSAELVLATVWPHSFELMHPDKLIIYDTKARS